jgi:hypothetical protein
MDNNQIYQSSTAQAQATTCAVAPNVTAISAEQRSADWQRARLGYITGSEISKIMQKGRSSDFSQTAMTYLHEKAAERCLISDIMFDDEVYQEYAYQNLTQASRAMQFGTQYEDVARSLFAQIAEVDIVEVSTCRYKDADMMLSASPDGLYHKQDNVLRAVEIKVPKVNTYMEYRSQIHDAQSLLKVKPEYYWQTMCEMACTDAQSVAFVVYNPFIECNNQLHIVQIERDEQAIAQMLERVQLANSVIDSIIAQCMK